MPKSQLPVLNYVNINIMDKMNAKHLKNLLNKTVIVPDDMLLLFNDSCYEALSDISENDDNILVTRQGNNPHTHSS